MTQPEATPDPLLSAAAIYARYLADERPADEADHSFTRYTVREWFNDRRFPLVKIGRRLYVRQSVFEAYLTASTIPARDPK